MSITEVVFSVGEWTGLYDNETYCKEDETAVAGRHSDSGALYNKARAQNTM